MHILALYGINVAEFKVDPVTSENDSEIIISGELRTNLNRVCPRCKSEVCDVKDIRYQTIKSQCSSFTEKTILIIIKKRRFICRECGKIFTQTHSFSEKGYSISNDARWAICRELKEMVSFSYIADVYHLTPQTVKNIFMEMVHEGRDGLPVCLCIDEKNFRTEHGKYICVLGNAVTCSIVDVLKNRTLAYMFEYFSLFSENERKKVKFFTSDMYSSYRTIKQIFFKDAIHIIDPFHVSSLFTRTISNIRKQYMNDYPKKTWEYKFIKKNWKLFLINPYSEKAEKLQFTDNNGVVYGLKERIKIVVTIHPDFLYIYNLYSEYCQYMVKGADDEELKLSLSFIINKALSSTNKLIITLGKTLYEFYDEILNYYLSVNSYSVSNSPAEAINSKTQMLINISRGIRDFEVIRRRMLYSFKKGGRL